MLVVLLPIVLPLLSYQPLANIADLCPGRGLMRLLTIWAGQKLPTPRCFSRTYGQRELRGPPAHTHHATNTDKLTSSKL